MKKLASLLAVLAFLAGFTGTAAARDKSVVQVKGSDTMVHLASAWAEKYMQRNPNAEIAVTGGGSGTGIAALLNGTADIANSSRRIKPSEIRAAKSRGFEPREHIVGLDGIAVIVNPSNPLRILTLEQIKKIFSGEINNWKAFGGPNRKIVVYTRDSSSGTYAFFQEHVLGKNDYSVRARRLASNSAIVQSVAEDDGSIGYVGLGYLADSQGKVRALAVKKTDTSEAVTPGNETVKSGVYPISRGLQMYTRGEPQGDVKAFMDYLLGADGQAVLEEMGFVKK